MLSYYSDEDYTQLLKSYHKLQNKVKAQQVEIAKLRGLLERWEAQQKYLKDCFEGHRRWDSEALIRLKEDTTEALK